MSFKKISAFCLTFAAVGAASAAPASAVSGDYDAGALLPGSCDLTVWWNTAGNPMVGATVPNPTYCVRPIIAPLLTTTVDLPDISAE